MFGCEMWALLGIQIFYKIKKKTSFSSKIGISSMGTTAQASNSYSCYATLPESAIAFKDAAITSLSFLFKHNLINHRCAIVMQELNPFISRMMWKEKLLTHIHSSTCFWFFYSSYVRSGDYKMQFWRWKKHGNNRTVQWSKNEGTC